MPKNLRNKKLRSENIGPARGMAPIVGSALQEEGSSEVGRRLSLFQPSDFDPTAICDFVIVFEQSKQSIAHGRTARMT